MLNFLITFVARLHLTFFHLSELFIENYSIYDVQTENERKTLLRPDDIYSEWSSHFKVV